MLMIWLKCFLAHDAFNVRWIPLFRRFFKRKDCLTELKLDFLVAHIDLIVIAHHVFLDINIVTILFICYRKELTSAIHSMQSLRFSNDG